MSIVMRSNHLIIAAFDFDGTLTYGLPSRLQFLYYLVGASKLAYGLFQSYKKKLFKMNTISPEIILDQLLLSGFNKQEMESLAQQFFERILIKKMRPEALKCLEHHQKQNHMCVIISGAWDIYLSKVKQHYGFQRLICTELMFDKSNDVCTGKTKNGYCVGQNKLELFKKNFPNREAFTLYAYGDSKDDLPLLNYADYAFYRGFNYTQ